MASQGDTSTYFTGTHEVQECLEGQGEADLHTHKTNCKKNPGHKMFVPVKNFNIENFPSGYHDNDVYDVTKALADLIVRIAVNFTSPDRPEFIPGTKDPYPLYSTRGQNSQRTGTGWICDATRYSEGMEYKPGANKYITCPCPECDRSDTREKVWWNVYVRTSTHVVFDTSEARQASCRLWFDEDQSPVVKIHGWAQSGSPDIDGDMSRVAFPTHDVEVGEKLEEMVSRFDQLNLKLMEKYRGFSNKLAIVVSHPHGCSKQVSVGHWVDREILGHQLVQGHQIPKSRYTYTTSTCPGSSGALVYKPGGSLFDHPHTGSISGGLNQSGVCLDYCLGLIRQ